MDILAIISHPSVEVGTHMGRQENAPTAVKRLRVAVARWLSVGTTALLLYAGLMLVWVWWSAWRRDAVPNMWGEYHGSHGPWRHVYELRIPLNQALIAPFFAMFPAGFATLLNPTGKCFFLFALSLALFLLLNATHFWLID